MNKEPQLNDSFYLVTPNSYHLNLYETDDFVEVREVKPDVQVREIFVNAISRVETTEDSAKYFFNAKTKYHYSDKKDGVGQDSTYFELADGEGFARANYNGTVTRTFAEAQELAFKWETSMNQAQNERKLEMIENLESCIKKLKGVK